MVDNATARARQATRATVPGGGNPSWWEVALVAVGATALAALVVFAVAAVLEEDDRS
jgi:hypothetical protein